jgi:hypothetical protein
MNVVVRMNAIKASPNSTSPGTMPSLRVRLALAAEDVRESRRDGLPLARLLTIRYLVLVAFGR